MKAATLFRKLIVMLLCISFADSLKGQMLWLTNGSGDDGSKDLIAYPGSLQGVFVTGCTFTNPFSFAKLYVMKSTGQTSAQLVGMPLVDANNAPNTLTSFISCGYVQDELVFSVNEGTEPGEYDVLIDYNINGIFDGRDALIGEGADYFFSVKAYTPVNLGDGSTTPAIPPGALTDVNNLVNKVKADAGHLASKLEDLYNQYKKAMISLKALQLAMGILFAQFAKTGSSIVSTIGGVQAIKLGSTAAAPFAAGASKAGDIAAEFAIARYKSIEKDPPTNDYDQIAFLDSVDLRFPNELNTPVSIFLGKNYTLFSIEQRIAAAELKTLERLQGAVLANNPEGAYRQASYLKTLIDLQVRTATLRRQNWVNLRNSMPATDLDAVIRTDSAKILQQQLLQTGLSTNQKKVLSFYGWSATEIDNEKRGFLSWNVSTLDGMTYRQVIDQNLVGEDSILNRILSQRALTIKVLSEFGEVNFPSYAISGPENGLVGEILPFTYQATNGKGATSTGGFLYNNSSVNINSPGFNVAATAPGYILLSRTASNGASGTVNYWLIEVAPSNLPPVVTSYTPAHSEIELPSFEGSLNFKVTASDPENDAISFQWYLNGEIIAGNQDSLKLPALSCSDVFYNIRVEIKDAAAGNYKTVQEWNVNILGNSALCNNKPTNKNATYWYFGFNCGLKFGGSRPVPLVDGALNNFEGVSSMSDAEGNFLFSTNGINVWNKKQKVMPNGSGLLSDASATQGPLTIPYPGKRNKYFVFTVGSAWGGTTNFVYNIINMDLDGGNGDIEVKNQLLMKTSSEKLSAVYHQNQRHIWVLTADPLNGRMLAWLVTENGISENPVISTVGPDTDAGPGYMRLSPDGKLLAKAVFNHNFVLYNFNTLTGEVSNKRVFPMTGILGGFGSYGIEFSPNSRFLYVGDHRGNNSVFQFDLSHSTIQEIISNRVQLAASPNALGGMQLGPDGRIYVARESGFLGVINNPNAKGLDCNYVVNGQFLNGKTSSLGLPGFISSILITNQISYDGNCAEAPTHFTLSLNDTALIDSVHWNFGDGNSSNMVNPAHTYSAAGTYNVRVFVRYDSMAVVSDSLFATVIIQPTFKNDLKVLYFGPNPLCDDSVFLSSSQFADGYHWYKDGQRLEGANGMSYWATQTGTYNVRADFVNSCQILSNEPVNLQFLPPPVPEIELKWPSLQTKQAYTSYQWYYEGNLLSGETGRSITPQLVGKYTVKVTGENGCEGETSFIMNQVLPLKWLSFTGKYANNQSQLFWKTSHEQNTKYFDVEHSVDNKHFHNIGQVAATGLATSISTYSFNHFNPATGENYYRLRQVDNDGNMSISPVVVIKVSKERWSANPNPVVRYLYVKGLRADETAMLTDAAGRWLMESKNGVLDMGGLPKGIYLLVIKSGDGTVSRKIVKE